MEFLVFIRGSVGKNLAISQEADTFIVRPATKLKMAAINVRFFFIQLHSADYWDRFIS